MSELSISTLSKYFIYATIFNLTFVVAITIPVIVPEFTFPIILTVWPGTWMFIAYFAFILVGVVGSLGWAVLLNFIEDRFHKHSVNRYLSEAHFALTYVGIFGVTSLMFRLGDLGGTAILSETGKGVVTQGLIGWMVVPIGIFLYLLLIGTVIGIANVILTISRPEGM
jgi:hypothetical protein